MSQNWPTLERSIAVSCDPEGTKGQGYPVVTGERIVAGVPSHSELDRFPERRAIRGIACGVNTRAARRETPRGRDRLLPTIPETRLPCDPAPVVITSSVGADRIQERLVSNLLPVVELPQTVFSAETSLRMF